MVVLLLLLVALLNFPSSQSPKGSLSFVRTFWVNDHAYIPHILTLPDGDIIFAYEGDFPSERDLIVHRLDNRGEHKWAKRFDTE